MHIVKINYSSQNIRIFIIHFEGYFSQSVVMMACMVSITLWLRLLFVCDVTLTSLILSELIILLVDIARFSVYICVI